MDCVRYAIWWVPRPGTALARFGADWTGWCADRGVTQVRRALSALSRPWPGVPGAVRLRGLHATVHSLFRLAPGRSAWALEDAIAELAQRTAPIRLPRLRLVVDGGRVVLAPMRPDEALNRLLADAVEAVTPSVVAQEYAALTGTGLVAAGGIVLPDDPVTQTAAPAAPGRFRIALTDRMDPSEAAAIVAELSPVLGPVLLRRQTLADLALVGDPGRGRPWRLLDRFTLDGEDAEAGSRLPAEMDCTGPSLIMPIGSGDRAAA